VARGWPGAEAAFVGEHVGMDCAVAGSWQESAQGGAQVVARWREVEGGIRIIKGGVGGRPVCIGAEVLTMH
jgi:hypothetical protein